MIGYVVRVYPDLSKRKILMKKRNLPLGNPALVTTILEHAIEGILLTNRFGVIEQVNAAFLAMTGYKQEEVVGKTPDHLYGESFDSAFFRDLLATLVDEHYWEGEVWNRKKNGEAYLEKLRVAAIREPSGRVVGYLAIITDITAHRNYEARIQHELHHDPLTGLVNRIHFIEKITDALKLAKETKEKLAVLVLDLDRFKGINESFGSAVGDVILQRVAEGLTGTVGPECTVARLGGDEFAILLPCVKNEKEVIKTVSSILHHFEQPMVLEGNELFLTVSVGLSLYPYDGSDPESLMNHADSAMYQAMEISGSSYQFYTADMNRKAVEQVKLESSLRKALERQELIVYYQPQVDLQTGKVIGTEALIRWQHPELGLLSPTSFIPIAEETGFIIPIGEWILRSACEQTKAWQLAGYPPIRVAVNLSSRQFQQEHLLETVTRVLSQTSLEPHFLELEITESIAMNNVNHVIDTLHRLKSLGVTLAIDDFGTGYSSLSYLSRFPINNLKIDRSFVSNFTSSHDDATIVKAIISLAKGLNLYVTAEGVETSQQVEFLRKLHCNKVQGYLYSEPLSAAEFEAKFLQAARW